MKTKGTKTPAASRSNTKPAASDEASAPAAEADEEDEEEDEDETEASEEATSGDAAAIAASAEAKAHPQLALAAIRSGMSMAQFKATVEASAAQPRVSRLDAAMSGQRRVGPDAARAETGRAGFGARLAERAAERRKA